MYGLTYDQGEWRRKHNKEICDPYNIGDISSEVRCRRLIRAGHILRTGEECPVKQFLKTP